MRWHLAYASYSGFCDSCDRRNIGYYWLLGGTWHLEAQCMDCHREAGCLCPDDVAADAICDCNID